VASAPQPGPDSLIDMDELFDDFEQPRKQPFFNFKDSKLTRWFLANAFYIIFFVGCLAVIAATVFYFLSRQDARRFLTTTRLSVLDKMVQKGCRYIESNYMNPELSVSLVCKELVTGEAYLDTLFLKEIGVDVRDFISQVRVDRIKKMLVKGMQGDSEDMDVDNICKQCGFPDRLTAERTFAKLCKGVGVGGYLESLKSQK
jgi:AraC-like DNA-binding protein